MILEPGERLKLNCTVHYSLALSWTSGFVQIHIWIYALLESYFPLTSMFICALQTSSDLREALVPIRSRWFQFIQKLSISDDNINHISTTFIRRLTSTTSPSIPSILSVNIFVNEPFPLFPDWIGRKNLCAFRALSMVVEKKRTHSGGIHVEMLRKNNVQRGALWACPGACFGCINWSNSKMLWHLPYFRALLLSMKTWECLALQISAHTTSFIIDGLYGCRSITIVKGITLEPRSNPLNIIWV